MSRGFIKETDQEDTPLVTPRADLPPGAKNYVTPRGLRLLHKEEEALQQEIRELVEDSAEANRVQINYRRAKLQQLAERIACAELVEPRGDAPDVVAFGSSVKVEEEGAEGTACYQIVGVDVAAPREGLLSYLSPFARVLMGRRAGETITLNTPKGERVLRLVGIENCAG